MKIKITTDKFVYSNYIVKKMLKNNNVEISDDEDVVGMIAGTKLIDKDFLDKHKKLKVISRFGVGMDNIDIEECEKRNISIYNTPRIPSEAVSELTLLLILYLLRKNKELLKNKIVGIIGYGNIGQTLEYLLNPFDVTTIVYDPEWPVFSTTFHYLLEKSDIITLHIPLNNSNRNLISYKELKLMKNKPIIINTSRKGIVNIDSIKKGLSENKISGFASDVDDDIKQSHNVILTPHIGSDTIETLNEMSMVSLENLLEDLML